MICKNCGVQNEEKNKFCKNCGQLIYNDNDSLNQISNNNVNSNQSSINNNSNQNQGKVKKKKYWLIPVCNFTFAIICEVSVFVIRIIDYANRDSISGIGDNSSSPFMELFTKMLSSIYFILMFLFIPSIIIAIILHSKNKAKNNLVSLNNNINNR